MASEQVSKLRNVTYTLIEFHYVQDTAKRGCKMEFKDNLNLIQFSALNLYIVFL